mgnify:CR=1 FL=1
MGADQKTFQKAASPKLPVETTIGLMGFKYDRALYIVGRQTEGRAIGSPFEAIAYGDVSGRLYAELRKAFRDMGLDPDANTLVASLYSGEWVELTLTGNWRPRRETDQSVPGSTYKGKWLFVASDFKLSVPESRKLYSRREQAKPASQAKTAQPKPRTATTFNEAFAAFDGIFSHLAEKKEQDSAQRNANRSGPSFNEAFGSFDGIFSHLGGQKPGFPALDQTTRDHLAALDLTAMPSSAAELRVIWKAKLQSCHPDTYGDQANEMAARANAARDALLKLVAA